jgi:hypothetical protein
MSSEYNRYIDLLISKVCKTSTIKAAGAIISNAITHFCTSLFDSTPLQLLKASLVCSPMSKNKQILRDKKEQKKYAKL